MSEAGAQPDDGRWVRGAVPLLFASIGGGVGGLALWVFTVAMIFFDGASERLADIVLPMLGTLLLMPILGPMIGLPSAFATGLIAAVIIRLRPHPLIFVISCSLVGGGMGALQTLLPLWPHLGLQIMASAGAASGAICAFLTLKLLAGEPTVQPRSRASSTESQA